MKTCLSFIKIAILICYCACLITIPIIQTSYAQEKYPSRSIEVIIPSNPGGVQDLTTRIFIDELSKVLKTPVASLNKPGANQSVGIMFALDAKKDGYTLLAASESATVIGPHITANIPYVTLRDLKPIAIIGISPLIICVAKNSPLKSFDDLINAAKKNPGNLTYGTAGVGSDAHLIIEQLQRAANVKFSHIPFKGGGEVIPNVMGGHIDFGSVVLGTSASHLRAGTLRGLVLAYEKRFEGFPDIPTYAEKGYTQHFINWWGGLYAPTGVPQTVMDVLVSASEKVVKSESFKKRMDDMYVAAKQLTPSEIAKLIEQQDREVKTIVKNIGIEPKKK